MTARIEIDMKKTLSSRLATARCLAVVVLVLCFHATSFAQPDRITGEIGEAERFTLRGHLHRQAQSLYDQGRADSYLTIERLTLVLKPSDTQAAELNRLLGELQYPKSGNYRKWLTPETYAERFGASQSDIAKIVRWLTAQQLTVTGVSRARNAIMLRGRAELIESAFQTEIHMYGSPARCTMQTLRSPRCRKRSKESRWRFTACTISGCGPLAPWFRCGSRRKVGQLRTCHRTPAASAI